MIRTFAVLLLAACSAMAAENAAVGTWDCVSKAGAEAAWKLLVTQQEGKLSGTMSGETGDMPLIEPRLDGNAFTFRIRVNAQCTVRAKVKIEGNRFEGEFGCEDGTAGTLKGSRRS